MRTLIVCMVLLASTSFGEFAVLDTELNFLSSGLVVTPTEKPPYDSEILHFYDMEPARIIEQVGVNHYALMVELGGIPSIDLAQWVDGQNENDVLSDRTVNGNTLELRDGACVQFDGTADYIEDDTQLVSDYPFTVSVWGKYNDAGMLFSLVDKDDNSTQYAMQIIEPAGDMRLRVYKYAPNFAGETGNTILSTSTWYHFTAVFLADEVKMYVNGEYDGSLNNSQGYSQNVNRWSIGRAGDSSPGSYFEGSLSDVRIYDRVLSGNEVASLYNKQTVTNGLVACYPLAETAGDTAYDVSGNDNHGTLHANGSSIQTMRSATQDENFYNYFHGFSPYTNGATDEILVPYLTTGTAQSPSIAGYTKRYDVDPAGKDRLFLPCETALRQSTNQPALYHSDLWYSESTNSYTVVGAGMESVNGDYVWFADPEVPATIWSNNVGDQIWKKVPDWTMYDMSTGHRPYNNTNETPYPPETGWETTASGTNPPPTVVQTGTEKDVGYNNARNWVSGTDNTYVDFYTDDNGVVVGRFNLIYELGNSWSTPTFNTFSNEYPNAEGAGITN